MIEETPCEKKKYFNYIEGEDARLAAEKRYQKTMLLYRCPKCWNFHLSSGSKKRNKRSGTEEGRKRNKYRNRYRREQLPIERWEDEGGSYQ